VGLTAKHALPMKPYIGKEAYTISCLIELCRRQSFTYDFIIDDGRVKIDNLWTHYLQIYNGKFGGGKINLNPLGVLNDGLMELVYRTGYVSASHAINLFF